MTNILAPLPEGLRTFGTKALTQIHDSEVGREIRGLQRMFQPYEDMIETEMEVYDAEHPVVSEIDRILELVRIRQRITATHPEAAHLHERIDHLVRAQGRLEYDMKQAFIQATGTEEQFQALRQAVMIELLTAPVAEKVEPPVARVKSEEEIKAEYATKVALMNQGLVAKYVPLIKAYERTVLRFHTELAAVMAFSDADLEQLENAFVAAHPFQTGVHDIATWEEEKRQYMNAGIDDLFPGVRQQMEVLCEDYGDQIEELRKPFSIENFTADGGTLDQLNGLHQAVLWGVFSRPRGPQGFTPA